MIELSKYTLDTLRNDKEVNFYRGWSEEDISQILVVSPGTEYPAPEILKRLEHEYSLREELDSAWAARPLEIARHWGRTVLVLEDPGGVPLDQLLGGQLDLEFSLRVAVDLSGVMDRLHQRGIIHKDLKPANVLVNSVSGRCWLKGFGIASRLPRERQFAESPELVSGTLAYMAPEQTGRMNRSIDSRSDLYSLGVTLYQMLTGSLPFTASEPMEWVHCHIARLPIPPRERQRDLPETVSAIILKLLSKTAEDRYQTAAGLTADLRKCLTEWESSRRISSFPLGAHDISDRLLMPEKLYGRDRQIKTLLEAFDQVVTNGKSSLLLVSGYSGIGKSSFVNELHKVLVPPRGLFASGKFDQYKRDVPYATLAQAFNGLVRPLLSKSESELQIWRDAFREALEPNAKLVVDLVPELKLILGEQPPVPDLPPQDAQGRFQLVFRRFIGVFARPEHPLALFLDDLQWLDAATLDFLRDLLTQPDVRHLMLIGAYRDNEVDPTHPLWRSLTAIRQTCTAVRDIVLAPLAREDLGQLIVDSLHCEPEHAIPLAQLVHEKTGGNPFFVIQFIYALVEEQLLTFNHHDRRWLWDLDRIHAKGYTDNVVDLMVRKLNRLAVRTQKVVQELACLGSSAETTTLSIIDGTSEEQVHSDLWEAVLQGLIARQESAYKFIHDRIQEAAYSLIPEHSRAETHLRVGRLLWAHVTPEKREESIFEIVNQLNRGAALITSQDERERLAELNLVAGKRAKSSTAYHSALNYLATGAALLSDDCWEHNYPRIFPLELHRAECEFLTGQSAAAEERLRMLSSRASSAIDLATVTCLLVDLYTTLNRSERAVAVSLDYLRYLGIEWSPHPTEEEAREEYQRIWIQLGQRSIEELNGLPLMSDPTSLGTMDVLIKVLPPAVFWDPNLLSLTICRAVNLSLERGNSDGSCVAYVFFGKIAGPQFGDYKAGFRFAQLGYDLVEKHGLERFQARTYLWFGQFIMPWTKHLRHSRGLTRRAFEAAYKVGDLTIAAYSFDHLNANSLATGDSLVEAQRVAENGLEFVGKARFGMVVDIIGAQLALIRTLRGLTKKFGFFDEEAGVEHHFASVPEATLPQCWYWIRKLQARFFAGEYDSALDAAAKAHRLLWTSPSIFETAEYHFYGALSHAASCDSAFSEGQRNHLEALAAHHRQLEIWAENCPENFENRAALVAAEIERLQDQPLKAEHLYEQAIRSASANGFIHHEAVANELAARFYAARGFHMIAHAYLRKARHSYLLWGAAGKVRQLDELYPQLREEEPMPGPTSTIGTSAEHLDLATVIKVSQAVSGEIVLEKLIDTLMRTAIENAGAERGLLIVPRGVEQRIEAEATTSGETIIVRLREASMGAAAVPESIVHYVVRTRESVILDDASLENPFSADTYLRQRHAHSILCLPLINQTKLIGLLYLENNLTPHVFTPKRIAVLKLLASQAAISLENTRLYRDLEEREIALRRSETYLSEAQRLSQTGSFGWDLIRSKIYWSQETYRIFGYDPPTEPTLELVLDRTHPEDKGLVRKVIDRVSNEKKEFDFEHRLLMPDGCVKYLRVVGHPSTKDESDRVEFVGAVTDITERKLGEKALQQKEVSLHETQAALAHVSRVTTMGELAASIAHEVNQPLVGVVTNAGASLRYLAWDSPNLVAAREAIRAIIRDGNRAAEVVLRVRAFFKKACPTKEPLNINEAIEEVVRLTQAEARRNKVTLQVELAANVPSVLADRVQVQQVVMNLILNGIQAMSAVEGRQRLLVASTQRSEGDQVRVTVQDCGVGIDPGDIERVFDAFHTTKPGGMGMGLSISRSIVESHGGRLWATPNDGPGVTLHFTL